MHQESSREGWRRQLPALSGDYSREPDLRECCVPASKGNKNPEGHAQDKFQ